MEAVDQTVYAGAYLLGEASEAGRLLKDQTEAGLGFVVPMPALEVEQQNNNLVLGTQERVVV